MEKHIVRKILQKIKEFCKSELPDANLWQTYLVKARLQRIDETSNIYRCIEYYKQAAELMAPLVDRKRRWFSWSKCSRISQEVAEDLLEVYYHLGMFQVLQQDLESAIESLKIALHSGGRKQPFISMTHFYLGRAYLKSGKTRKARKFYNNLLKKIDPYHQWSTLALIYYDIGQSYYKEKKYKKAIKYQARVLDIEDVRPELLEYAYLGVGHSYFAMDQFEQAVIHYREYLRICDVRAAEKYIVMKYLVYANERLARKN